MHRTACGVSKRKDGEGGAEREASAWDWKPQMKERRSKRALLRCDAMRCESF